MIPDFAGKRIASGGENNRKNSVRTFDGRVRDLRFIIISFIWKFIFPVLHVIHLLTRQSINDIIFCGLTCAPTILKFGDVKNEDTVFSSGYK